MKTVLVRIFVFSVLAAALIVYLGRGPDYEIEWKREVPSKEALATLESALDSPKNWPVFYHALHSVKFSVNGRTLPPEAKPEPGMRALFLIEPKNKEWKRFVIDAEVLAVRPGESVRFKLLSESTGKTTRVVDSFEWEISLRAATEEEAKKGYSSFVMGSASAFTKNARARFFGRVTPKILMNQLYQIDLVKLANYSANVEAIRTGTEPVYR
jgi:hypothetical protein